MKGIVWIGSSRDDLLAFPPAARREAGFQLDKVQHGEEPDDWKSMKTVGPGVREIRIRDEGGTFRVIHVAQIGDSVHILHCFRKNTPKTSLHDLRLARHRFKALTSEKP